MLTKVHKVKVMIFPVVIYGCESWTIRKAEHQRMDILNCDAWEDSWNSLDCKEIEPVNPKGNQPWIFTGRTDVQAQAPVLWAPYAKSWLIGKEPDAGKEWRKIEKRVAEDEGVR